MLKLILQIFLICMLFLYKKHRTLVHFVIFIYQFNLMDKYIRKFIFLNVFFLFHSSAYSQGWLPMGSRSQSIANASVAISDLWSYHHNPAASSKVKNFGVGLRNYLFENFTDIESLEDRIRSQVDIHIPQVELTNVKIEKDPNSNELKVSIFYRVIANNESDAIKVNFSPDEGLVNSGGY